MVTNSIPKYILFCPFFPFLILSSSSSKRLEYVCTCSAASFHFYLFSLRPPACLLLFCIFFLKEEKIQTEQEIKTLCIYKIGISYPSNEKYMSIYLFYKNILFIFGEVESNWVWNCWSEYYCGFFFFWLVLHCSGLVITAYV